jgi:hypothetical protein
VQALLMTISGVQLANNKRQHFIVQAVQMTTSGLQVSISRQ